MASKLSIPQGGFKLMCHFSRIYFHWKTCFLLYMFSYLGRNLRDIWGLENNLFYWLKAHHQVKVTLSTNALLWEREVFIWAIGRMTMDTARVTGDSQPLLLHPSLGNRDSIVMDAQLVASHAPKERNCNVLLHKQQETDMVGREQHRRRGRFRNRPYYGVFPLCV